MLLNKQRLVLCLVVLFVSGCSTEVGPGFERHNRFSPRYLVKSDVDRVIDAHHRVIMSGLKRMTEKLYYRNPWEWQKLGLVSHEVAINRLFLPGESTPSLLSLQSSDSEGVGIMHALSPEFKGDRVFVYISGLQKMVNASFGYKQDFYMFDDLNEQKLYNCARNFEIAAWKLSHARSESGALLLLSNDLDKREPNLSFEREFGRMIGALDMLAVIMADKHGRSVTRITQSVATAVFLPIGGL